MSAVNKTWQFSWLLNLAAVAVVVASLYLAKGLLVPLTLAALLSFSLIPACDWLERWRVGRVPAVLLTALLGFSLLGIVLWAAAVEVGTLGPKLPEYQRHLEVKLAATNACAVVSLGEVTRTFQGMGTAFDPSPTPLTPLGTDARPSMVRVLASPASPMQVFAGVFGTLLEGLGTTGVVIVLVVFFLVRREALRDRFIGLVGRGHLTVTTQILQDAASRVSRYLSILCLLNVAFGAAVGIGVSLIGVPNAILWGILAAGLRFIPYLGPWIAAAMPIGLSLAISGGWAAPLLKVALFVVLEMLNNNIVEPWLYGGNTGVSAVPVLVAAIFWKWLWGTPGLLLATPLTVCVLVVGRHVPQFSFLEILLGSEPVFDPKPRIYQRLLVSDQEAASLLAEYQHHQTLVEVHDGVLIPALALIETDWHRGELVAGRHEFMMQSLRDLIQDQAIPANTASEAHSSSDLGGRDGSSDAVAHGAKKGCLVLSLPARMEADESAALMFAQVLAFEEGGVRVMTVAELADDQRCQTELANAVAICLSATAPGGGDPHPPNLPSTSSKSPQCRVAGRTLEFRRRSQHHPRANRQRRGRGRIARRSGRRGAASKNAPVRGGGAFDLIVAHDTRNDLNHILYHFTNQL